MSLRRVRAEYTNLNEVKRKIRSTDLYLSMNGCACDVENSTIFISLTSQRPSSWWDKLTWLKNIEPWTSREKIDSFAKRMEFVYIPGKREDRLKGVGDPILEDLTLVEILNEVTKLKRIERAKTELKCPHPAPSDGRMDEDMVVKKVKSETVINSKEKTSTKDGCKHSVTFYVYY